MIQKLIKKVNNIVKYCLISWRFKEYDKTSSILRPILITPSCIKIGKYSQIRDGGRIEGVFSYNGVSYDPQIVIGNNVGIEQGLHLTCANSIKIGDNTSISAFVTITDINHPYIDVNTPIASQTLEVKEVVIGNGCKIYNGAVILPGVHIGCHVTIGANSVVTHDIPDYCVAVGAPARIIKRYNHKSQRWEKTDKQGNFLE